MMSAALKVLQLGASLFGLRLSPFATGALAAAGLAIGLAGAAGYLVHLGAGRAEQACEAGTLRAQNDALAAELRDKQRSLALINGIAERDAVRAEAAEAQLRNNQANINATPQNPLKCFPRAAAGRVRSVR
jgi:hypothetical protein